MPIWNRFESIKCVQSRRLLEYNILQFGYGNTDTLQQQVDKFGLNLNAVTFFRLTTRSAHWETQMKLKKYFIYRLFKRCKPSVAIYVNCRKMPFVQSNHSSLPNSTDQIAPCQDPLPTYPTIVISWYNFCTKKRHTVYDAGFTASLGNSSNIALMNPLSTLTAISWMSTRKYLICATLSRSDFRIAKLNSVNGFGAKNSVYILSE